VQSGQTGQTKPQYMDSSVSLKLVELSLTLLELSLMLLEVAELGPCPVTHDACTTQGAALSTWPNADKP